MGDWITFSDGSRGRRSWDGDEQRAARWQALLASVHGADRRPHCDCRHQGAPVELVVRRSERREGGRVVQAYHLARFPGQGELHGVSCPFHERDPRGSGRDGYTQGVIQPMADGRQRVALACGLRRRDQAAEATERTVGAENGAGGGGVRQTRMTLLGLLHLLWEEAGLSAWSPGVGRRRRWWPGVRHELERCSREIVPARGHTLADYLAVVGYRDADAPALVRATVARCAAEWRVLFIGAVDRIVLLPGRQGGEFVSVRFDGAQDYDLRISGKAAWAASLRRRFPMAMTALARERADRDIRVIGLVAATARLVRPGERQIVQARADDIALMEVEPDTLIPVASSHELRVARALCVASRSFIKPLRFDAHRDTVHPDFVLTDTGHPRGTPMEVFGRTDEAYEARRAEKAAYYRDVYGQDGWWCWDAASAPGVMPAFPAWGGHGEARDV
ncbi:DUF1173 domain-containing protein [Acetobacter sp. TBRC 12305]|uniref:DUF1173 family protein n=1 Tax=Acetobacter garciniae TaxID=2817435 RepID=A0A939KRV1_9PROT|nr:DUF1173 family protein [Acetobacter garciniae]MBO1326216.1 DUF1173 family protein [Acetobacter garciniae]MBX0346047.1 DUF1173 domain-containing protein [Acetobacter garciniae]